ncbi:DUF2878 domain-containing protein [Parashewanella curva]|nr:DUF2878 domain-containing protein [Parashewanella curva]
MLFNLMWLGCVKYGNNVAPFVLVWAIVHLWMSSKPWQQLALVSFVTFVGIFVDTVLMHAGFFQFPNQGEIIPLWLAMMWLSFALTINGCLSLLTRSKVLQWIFGMVFAPLAYWGGISMSDASFGQPFWLTLMVIGALWSILMLLFFEVNERLKKVESFA